MSGPCDHLDGPSQPGGVRAKLRPQADRHRSHQRHSTAIWDQYKDNIRHLYLDEDLTCKDVAESMEENHQFSATPRQYKTRLDRWCFFKNVTQRDWQQAALLLRERFEAGRRTQGFYIHGNFKSVKELYRHIEGWGMSEDEFVSEARRESIRVSDVRCVSPSPEPQMSLAASKARLTSAADSRDSAYGTMPREKTPTPSTSTGPSSGVRLVTPSTRNSKTSSSCAGQSQDASPTTARGHHNLNHKPLDPDTRQGEHDPEPPEPSLPPSDGEVQAIHSIIELSPSLARTSGLSETVCDTCDVVQQDMGLMAIQVYRPGALDNFTTIKDVDSWSLISSPQLIADSRTCSKCQMPLQAHAPLPEDWLYGDPAEFPQRLSQQPLGAGVYASTTEDDASTFQICCFAACMVTTQKRYEILAKHLRLADEIFRRMLLNKNRLSLLAVLIALTILHVHDQGDVSASIIRSTLAVCQEIRGKNNPWTMCIEWLSHAAGRTLKTCRVDVNLLNKVLAGMREDFGTHHEHTIVAQYCLAFQLALDKRYMEAETQYKELVEICDNTLAPAHIQTTSCRNGLSRVQSRQGDQESAIRTLQMSLNSQPLGPNHPFRLETKKRLAILYKKAGKKSLAEVEYWDVLRGRLKTLGKNHQFTVDARLQLERLLKSMGKWNAEVEESVQSMFQEGNATTDVEAFDCPSFSRYTDNTSA